MSKDMVSYLELANNCQRLAGRVGQMCIKQITLCLTSPRL